MKKFKMSPGDWGIFIAFMFIKFWRWIIAIVLITVFLIGYYVG